MLCFNIPFYYFFSIYFAYPVFLFLSFLDLFCIEYFYYSASFPLLAWLHFTISESLLMSLLHLKFW